MQDVIVAPPPLPPARPLPMEQTMPEQFTIEQLRELFKQVRPTIDSLSNGRERDSSLVHTDGTEWSSLHQDLHRSLFGSDHRHRWSTSLARRLVQSRADSSKSFAMKEGRSIISLLDRSIGTDAFQWIRIHQLASVVIIRFSTVASSHSRRAPSTSVHLHSTRHRSLQFHLSFDLQ